VADQMHLWPTAAAPERLRWSVSRARRLDACHRRYYLHHYASIGGKRAEAGSLAREAYVLKQLTNRYAWVGQLVHSLIESALTTWRYGGEVDADTLVDRGDARMRRDFSQSATRQFLTRPGEVFGLVEHAYAEDVSVEAWRQMRTRMERCVRHFVGLPLVAQMRKLLPTDWLALERMASFVVDDAAVVVVPDAAWRTPDKQVMLVDWKTGGVGEADAFQLGVYGLFARRVWDLQQCGIHAQDVYLEAPHTRSFVLDTPMLDAALARVSSSIAQMRALAARPAGMAVQASRFPKTNDLATCRHCVFRRLCDREQADRAPQQDSVAR
jgi:hypothetical protein